MAFDIPTGEIAIFKAGVTQPMAHWAQHFRGNKQMDFQEAIQRFQKIMKSILESEARAQAQTQANWGRLRALAEAAGVTPPVPPSDRPAETQLSWEERLKLLERHARHNQERLESLLRSIDELTGRAGRDRGPNGPSI